MRNICHKIDIKKLVKSYNRDYHEAVTQVYDKLKESHNNSFDKWREQLVAKIRTNIVKYSPKLSERARRIEEETGMIHDLENTRSILQDYKEKIVSFRKWETIG